MDAITSIITNFMHSFIFVSSKSPISVTCRSYPAMFSLFKDTNTTCTNTKKTIKARVRKLPLCCCHAAMLPILVIKNTSAANELQEVRQGQEIQQGSRHSVDNQASFQARRKAWRRPQARRQPSIVSSSRQDRTRSNTVKTRIEAKLSNEGDKKPRQR